MKGEEKEKKERDRIYGRKYPLPKINSWLRPCSCIRLVRQVKF